MANTFSTSQIIDEVKKVKLPFHRGFSDSDRVTKKMDKVELKRGYKVGIFLLVPVDQQVWGDFDPETMVVDLHSEPQPDDQDMLDFDAIHTLLNGGAFYTVDAGELPNGVPAAAIFRY